MVERAASPARKPIVLSPSIFHAHWVPPAIRQGDGGPRAARSATPSRSSSTSTSARKWMDEHGVQMHVLTLNGGMPWQLVTPEEGVRLAQIVNDAGVEAARQRFPTALSPRSSCRFVTPTSALKELNRVAGKPGLRAVHLPDSIDNRDYLFQPEFAPLLARIEELGYPILFHNLNSDLFGRRPADAGLDNTFAHAVLAAKFISTGTLDRFPKLEIVLPHAGGAFPFVAGRT